MKRMTMAILMAVWIVLDWLVLSYVESNVGRDWCRWRRYNVK